jgi:hypothetical protein
MRLPSEERARLGDRIGIVIRLIFLARQDMPASIEQKHPVMCHRCLAGAARCGRSLLPQTVA